MKLLQIVFQWLSCTRQRFQKIMKSKEGAILQDISTGQGKSRVINAVTNLTELSERMQNSSRLRKSFQKVDKFNSKCHASFRRQKKKKNYQLGVSTVQHLSHTFGCPCFCMPDGLRSLPCLRLWHRLESHKGHGRFHIPVAMTQGMSTVPGSLKHSCEQPLHLNLIPVTLGSSIRG